MKRQTIKVMLAPDTLYTILGNQDLGLDMLVGFPWA
jgi:hypothetical protein